MSKAVAAFAALSLLPACGDLGVSPGIGAQSGFNPVPVCSAGARMVTVAGTLGSSYRIKNGTPVLASDCSHVVRLDITNPNGKSLCSGTLIADQVVLTAAHCMSHTPTSVTVSIPDMNVKSAATHYRIYGGAEPLRVETDLDLALLYLKDALPGAKPASLATEPLAKGAEMIALGYGYDGQKGGDGNLGTLLAGWVNVDIPGTADKNTRTLAKVQPLSDRRSQDTCAGDSGGPLVLATKAKTLYGVLSGGNYRSFPSCNHSADSYWQSVSHKRSYIDDGLSKGTEGATELTNL